MPSAPRDVAQIRLDNAMRLFEEFVSATVKHPDAAALRGLERRFAERLQIQPSYWSQIKGRSRQIGERLARQFEQLCHKPPGWLDLEHVQAGAGPSQARQEPMSMPGQPGGPAAHSPAGGSDNLPQDDDERFIVGLVLTYYRRHPQRARTRLLDLLGEVLAPEPAPPPPARPAAASPQAELDAWRQLQSGVAPLKPKKR
ncbi:MAG: hypothetical protein QM788_01090 [Roseateles sp.]|uniref:hypothetical protein n=1 Tax=Roseateles sp. TaxID=1971397 RepID=UPI0039EB9CAB